MSIDRDDCDDGRTRVDRMIDEFREAQSRRLAKAIAVTKDERAVKSRRDAHAQAVARLVATLTSHPND